MRIPVLVLGFMVVLTSFCFCFQQDTNVRQTALQKPEAISLLNKPLYAIDFPPEIRARLDSNLRVAISELQKDPDNPDKLIWVGRRLAYLWKYREAIDVFSEGIKKFPGDARFYRHRGHRYITIREFDKAIADLQQAAHLINGKPDEVEPDGQPNNYNIPTSTLQSNIWYHLGLAHYLKGDFEKASEAYAECMKVSSNPDMLCATSDWLYMTYRRRGHVRQAQKILEPITKDMNILENSAYHKRLLMYKGELPIDSLLNTKDATELDIATQGYGVGNWYFYNGQKEKALLVFRKVIEGTYWAAFGYIAAEADVRRMSQAK